MLKTIGEFLFLSIWALMLGWMWAEWFSGKLSTEKLVTLFCLLSIVGALNRIYFLLKESSEK